MSAITAISSAEAHAATVSAKLGPDRLWTAPWEEIHLFEVIPGVPMSDNAFVIPKEWVSVKSLEIFSRRTIDFTSLLQTGMSPNSDFGDAPARRAKRLAVIVQTTTVTLRDGRVRNPCKPITWADQCRDIVKAMAWILENTEPINAVSTCPDGPPVFKRLTKETLQALCISQPMLVQRRTLARLAAIAASGVIDDWPSFDIGDGPEPKRRDTDAPDSTTTEKVRWKPFSDEFTARIGATALWMTESLGPALLECLQEIMKVPRILRHIATWDEKKDAIAAWAASSDAGTLAFPFTLMVPGARRKLVGVTAMPPEHWRMLKSMLSLLQTAHMVIVALATAGRNSDIIGIPRNCLRTVVAQDLLVGYTFKLSDGAHGERRDWPLPKIAVTAIRQQQRILELLALKGNFLWISFGLEGDEERYNELKTMSNALTQFCKRVIVDGRPFKDWCEDGNVHSHRFRETVARLAALSMVGATSIMFDILGHRDPEMTLNYILSDPGLQDEIRKIAFEASVMLAKQALEAAEENGGPAAPHVVDLKQRLAARSGERDIGVDSIQEAAEILSMNGQVTMVRPGVLCTKTMGQRGPCTRRSGIPEIGNCSTGCHHRLDLAAARQDCEMAIEKILHEMPSPEFPLKRGWWQGQLLTHLRRFPGVRRRYLDDDRVSAAFEGVDPAFIAELRASPGDCRGNHTA